MEVTFFIVGMNAVNHPSVVSEIHSRGHEVAANGWRHEDIAGVGREEEV
jgi:peptidoglycan/xylan/chitin deacetylase (PgdA/CDA1 family)